MKIPFWSDPNDDIEILEANDDEQKKYGRRYGSDTIVLSPEHIQALQAGKMLAWNDGEYSTFVVLAPTQQSVPPNKCPHCDGIGFIPHSNSLYSKCSSCDGLGICH